eukprot:4532675-Alexandrium_andersonii.AAC.1
MDGPSFPAPSKPWHEQLRRRASRRHPPGPSSASTMPSTRRCSNSSSNLSSNSNSSIQVRANRLQHPWMSIMAQLTWPRRSNS